MKPIQHYIRSAACIIVATSLTSLAFAAKKNPTSKIYVADLEGIAEIDTGERIKELSKRSVHNAQGTIIQTKTDSSNAMVFSNGTGIFFAPDTRVEVKRFSQEQFTPSRNDPEAEPSISQTSGFIPRGAIGLCVPRLVAGSSMVYQTPQGSMNIRGKKVVIETEGYETKVSMVEGETTVQGNEPGGGGQTIKGGEQAVIRRFPGQPPTLEIRPIPQEELAAVNDKVTLACNARKTVYFDVAENQDILGPAGTAGAGDEAWTSVFEESDETENTLIVVEVTPVEPPQEVVEVSASSIRPAI
jgi:hypothetical protein